MLDAMVTVPSGDALSAAQVRSTLEAGLGGRFAHARVLVLIPDHTRTLPLPLLFRELASVLADTAQLDFMVALGTHPALSDEALNRLVGISAEERASTYGHVGLLNHAWQDPAVLTTIGILSLDQLKALAGEYWHPSLGGDVPVRINRRVHDYDQIIILGPIFPHEVVGFSGGAKYLFPGISGPEMINVTHWLGALITVRDMIGIRDTPVRRMIHAAAELVSTPVTLISLVVEKDQLGGMFIGPHLEAFAAAAELSSERHIVWLDKPVQRVLSCAAPMYDELWTGAKAMYKLDPAVADGGEIIVYAPHLDVVSHVHGKYLYDVGYHVRDYFLTQWDRFAHVPLGVLAHSTHVKGGGVMEGGVEKPRIRVTLSTQISEADCQQLNLAYLDPKTVDVSAWQARAGDDELVVPKAGEMLYRVREQS